jgi:hypothetical protein
VGTPLQGWMMALSSDLLSRSEGSFGWAAGSPLRMCHHGSGHSRKSCALMAVGESRRGRCVWMERSAIRGVAARPSIEATCPSGIRRKEMNRKTTSLWRNRGRLEMSEIVGNYVSPQERNQRERKAPSTLPFARHRHQLPPRSKITKTYTPSDFKEWEEGDFSTLGGGAG